MATQKPKRIQQPTDPHLAQKEAVEALIPVEENPEQPDPEELAEEIRQVQIRARERASGGPLPEKLLPEGVVEENSPEPTEPTSVAGLKIDSPETARVMSQLQQELTLLRSEVSTLKSGGARRDGPETGSGGYPWQYYKRAEIDTDPQSGWITTAPGGAVPKGPMTGQRNVGAYAKYMSKGYKPLTRYGVPPRPSQVASMFPGAEFLTILQNGGAKEFPVSQVLAYKWHVSPPIKGLTFPQAKEAEAEGNLLQFLCDDCDFEVYFLRSDRETPRTCFRHLRVFHQYDRREASASLKGQGIPYRGGRHADAADRQRIAALTASPEGEGAPNIPVAGEVD